MTSIVEIEVAVRCACGTKLNARVVQSNLGPIVIVDPCVDCREKERASAWEDGYDTGVKETSER